MDVRAFFGGCAGTILKATSERDRERERDLGPGGERWLCYEGLLFFKTERRVRFNVLLTYVFLVSCYCVDLSLESTKTLVCANSTYKLFL